MSSRKATFYIDDQHRDFVINYQTQNALESPSAALRKIIEEMQIRPSNDESAELELLSEVLQENTSRARTALAEAFEEIETTRQYFRGLS